MIHRSCPRLPVAPATGEVKEDREVINDTYRQRLMDDPRLTIMHTRIYDHWRPVVGAPTAYELALAAWSDDARYQALKRAVGV